MGGAVFSEGVLTVSGCSFDNNSAIFGGGIYHAGTSGSVENSIFQNNRARGVSGGGLGPVARGGALFAGSNVTVNRCQFVGNEAAASFLAQGGAIGGGPLVTHCSFSGNTSSQEAAACAGGVIDSCAFADNLSAGSPLDSIGQTAQVSYSVVEGGFVGTGNRAGDPEFWGPEDLHLLPQSLAHDAGNPASPLDPDGSRADAGALPFDSEWCGSGCVGSIGFTPCTGFPHSGGAIAHLSALGSTEVALDRVVLNAAPVPANMFGYFLGARSPGSTPFFGGSQGVLCLGGAIYRFNSTILHSGNQASLSFRPRLNHFPRGQAVTAGERWYFQAWFRDSNAGFGQSNTSSALAIDF